MSNSHDDRFFVARFNHKLGEFRGRYGRKGQVGGSSEAPTVGTTPKTPAPGVQSMSPESFAAEIKKAAKAFGYQSEDGYAFTKSDPTTDVEADVTFGVNGNGARFVTVEVFNADGDSAFNRTEEIGDGMLIEDYFVAAEDQFDDAMLEYGRSG